MRIEPHEHLDRPNPAPLPLGWPRVVQGSVVGLGLALLVTVAFLVYHGSAVAAFQETAPPDVIIVIVADTLRADRLSCYGYTENQTPHIDALARDGVLYRHTNAPAAWTKPSVATLLTSLRPSTHQACTRKNVLPDQVLTLAEILGTYDYHSVGFISNYNLFSDFGFDQGFRTYYDIGPGESHQVDAEGKTPYAEAAVVNGHALPWLERECAKPGTTRFFMYVHYMDPHDPYHVHPFRGQVRKVLPPFDAHDAQQLSQAYDSEIAYLDQHLGKLIAALKRLGLYDDALIVFTSDHGEEFYEHQGWRHGETLYQEIVHVPLIIKYPGGAGAGTVDERLARTLDVGPTILDVADIEIPAVMQGVSLRLPLDSPALPEFSLAEDPGLAGVLALCTPRYKLIQVTDGRLRGRTPTQLYDLEVDPEEMRNLAKARPDVVARLRADMSRTLALTERAAVGGLETELTPDLIELLQRLGY